jgi:hypothetical protein
MREAAELLRAELREGDLVLTKGSRDHDHLSRLAFQFTRPVACWTESCRRRRDCERCRLLERGPARERLGGRAVETRAREA